jgi:two-component system sensor histidine kinase TctE
MPSTTAGSIQRRLAFFLIASAMLLALILLLITRQFTGQIAEQSQDNILAASAISILESVTQRADEISVDIPYAALAMLGNVSDDRVFYQVLAGEEHLTGYPDLPDALSADDPAKRRYLTGEYQRETIRMVQLLRRMTIGGETIDVAVKVAQTRNAQQSRLSAITNRLLWPGIAMFVLALLLAAISARSTVQPLRALADSVADRGLDNLEPVRAPVPIEMAPLVNSLNSLISRLKINQHRSEDFIAEAAHRVRTPLATVRSQAEIALMRVERPENRQSLKEMIRAIDESSRAAGQLLDHAMVSFRSDQLTLTIINPAELVIDTVARFQPIADMKDIQLNTTTDGSCKINADSILVQSAVRNIVENAIKYTDREDVIDVSVSCCKSWVCIRVIDNGEGFPAESTSLTERFTRGSNAGHTVGSGLGLTIASEVIKVHSGRLDIASNPNGSGACVSLYFPAC